MKLRGKIIWILALAFGLRLILLNQSLWLDEAIGAIVVRDFSFWDVLTRFPLTDNHPPLYYLILKAWTSIFGFSEISLRMPSVLVGVGTVYYVYLIGKLIFKKNKAFLPALFLATSPLHVYYSQEARMYALAGLFASMAVYYFLRVLKSNATNKDWIMFSLVLTLLVFTDYLPALMLFVFLAFSLFAKRNKKWWRAFVLSHLPILILGLLWLPIFLVQSEKGKWLLETLPAWKEVAGGANLKELSLVWAKFVFGRISLFNKGVYLFLVSVFSLPFIYSFSLSVRKKLSVLHYWLILPLVLGFLISFVVPAFTYFRFIFVLPAFYLVFCLGLERVESKGLRRLLITTVLLGNMLGLSIYFADDSQHREDWKGAVELVEGAKETPVLFVYPEPFAPYRWYSRGVVETLSVTNTISPEESVLKENTIKILESVDKIYYFEYLVDLTDPERIVEGVFESEGFTVEEIENFRGVGQVFLYVK